MHLDKMNYRETFDNKIHNYIFSGRCNCGEQQEITVNGPDLWQFRQGAHIQNAFPYLTDGEREFLMSGTCDKCWDKMFGPGEEENKDLNRLLKTWKLDE